MLREAVLNSSDCLVENLVYRFWRYERPIITKAKKKPSTSYQQATST